MYAQNLTEPYWRFGSFSLSFRKVNFHQCVISVLNKDEKHIKGLEHDFEYK